MDTPSIPLKRCSKKSECTHPENKDGWLPATTDYFNRASKEPDGFRYECKYCSSEYRRRKHAENSEHYRAVKRDYYARNADKERSRARRWRENNPEKILLASRKWVKNNPEKARMRSKRHYDKNREKILERRRKYHFNNRDKAIEQSRQWRHANAEHMRRYRERNASAIKMYNKLYRDNNKDAIHERQKQWRKAYPERVVLKSQHRRAQVASLPSNFTPAQWQRALDYFNGCCAVCGRQLTDLFGTLKASQDHWIPLTKGGGYTATNIIPLCNGLDGCNQRKFNKDPNTWLLENFGKRKAKQILDRIETYFEWVRQQDDN